MNRRLLTILTAAALASSTAACSSTLDTDAVARVGDETLSDEQLADFSLLVGGNEELPAADQAEAARAGITLWLDAQIVAQHFDYTDEDQASLDQNNQLLESQLGPQFAELAPETQTLLTEYVTGLGEIPQLPLPEEDEVRLLFERGDLACVTHILVATREEADSIVDQLAAAGSESDEAALFATLATQQSIDTGSGAQGGLLSCDTTANAVQQYVAPFAEAVLEATPGEPTDPVESQFGFHVLRLLPYDEAVDVLAGFLETGFIQKQQIVADADYSVDSRYGVTNGPSVVAPV